MSGPLPSVPKAAKIVLSGLIDGAKPFINAFHVGYSIGASLTATEVLGMATDVASVWSSSLGPGISDTVQLVEVIATALDSSTAPQATFASGAVGGQTTQSVAAGTSLVVQRKVGRRYRGGHSRVYLPGIPAATLDDTERNWDATLLAAFVSQWKDIEDEAVNYLVTAGHTDASAINISYFEGFSNVLYPSGRYHVIPTPRAVPVVDKVTSYAGNPRPCSQRRREQL